MAIWRAISKLMAYYPNLNFSSFQIFFNSKVYYTGTVQSPNDEESVGLDDLDCKELSLQDLVVELKAN